LANRRVEYNVIAHVESSVEDAPEPVKFFKGICQ